MNKILGVDPGSTCTGFGIITGTGDHIQYVHSGHIRLQKSLSRYDKLRTIFVRVQEVIVEHRPTHFAIEDIFYAKNVRSSLVLGEARGAAILAASLAELPIFEYAAREVKMSVTGHGSADKTQVKFMLGKILGLRETPDNSDESDALAIAICHAFKNREWSML